MTKHKIVLISFHAAEQIRVLNEVFGNKDG